MDPDAGSLQGSGCRDSNDRADHPVQVVDLGVQLEPSPTEADQSQVLAIERGDVAGTSCKFEQALDVQGVAKGLVSAHQNRLDLVARGSRGFHRAVAGNRQRT